MAASTAIAAAVERMLAGMIERSLAEFESAVTASELTEKGIAEKVEAFAAEQEQSTAADL